MNGLGLPTAKDLGTRFSIVGFLPTLTAVLIVLAVVWSGAPSYPPSYHRAMRSANELNAGAWVTLGLIILVLVLVTHPLELRLVRLLEGYPRGPLLRPVVRRLHNLQVKRWKALHCIVNNDGRSPNERLAAAEALRYGFPPREDRVLPTRLGNVLRAAEDRAGEYYGWSTVAAWPRLYMLLPDQAASLVADARNQLDTACKFTISFALAGMIAFALLVSDGAWCLLALLIGVMSWLSYRGAIEAARSYGAVIQAVFDLYRLELLRTMHLPLPHDAEEERRISAAVSQWFSQGLPHQLRYDFGGDDVKSC